MNKKYKMPEMEEMKSAFNKFAEETKEFLQKPRYVYCEDKKYIVDNELDVLVDMDGVIDRLNTQCFQKKELLRNIQIKDKQIADLQHRLEVAEKALELACSHIPCTTCPNSNGAGICYIAQDIGYYQPKENCNIDNSYYFKLKAEKEMKGE